MLVALGFLRLPIPEAARPPAFAALHRSLDSWRGIGAIEHGMAHQGYDLALTRYANEGWRATFYNAGKEHSYTSTTGSAWEPTAWRAVRGRRGGAEEAVDRAWLARDVQSLASRTTVNPRRHDSQR